MRICIAFIECLVGSCIGPVCAVCLRPVAASANVITYLVSLLGGNLHPPLRRFVASVGPAGVDHIGATVDSPPGVATRCVIAPASAMATRYAARRAIDLRT